MDEWVYIVIFLCSVLIASISQILLKKSANKQCDSKFKEYLNAPVIIAYFMFFAYGYYDVGNCIFANNDFLELILDNDGIFESIFKEKPYVYQTIAYFLKNKYAYYF